MTLFHYLEGRHLITDLTGFHNPTPKLLSQFFSPDGRINWEVVKPTQILRMRDSKYILDLLSLMLAWNPRDRIKSSDLALMYSDFRIPTTPSVPFKVYPTIYSNGYADRRPVVVEWLRDVSDEYGGSANVLFTAITILDWYNRNIEVPGANLQLMAAAGYILATCLGGATFGVLEMADVLEDIYTTSQITQMCAEIYPQLKVLNFEHLVDYLTPTTPKYDEESVFELMVGPAPTRLTVREMVTQLGRV